MAFFIQTNPTGPVYKECNFQGNFGSMTDEFIVQWKTRPGFHRSHLIMATIAFYNYHCVLVNGTGECSVLENETPIYYVIFSARLTMDLLNIFNSSRFYGVTSRYTAKD